MSTTTLEFLSYLRGLDIKVWAEGEKLRFRAPESALTAELRAELSSRKAELIEFLTQLTDEAGADVPPIRPREREGNLPLSFSQERLWFLDRLDPGSPAYNIHSATRFQGPLDAEALERSLTEMVRRHESLRTTFMAVDGKPVQVIAPPAPFRLPVIDLSALSAPDRVREMERIATEEAQTPFDLSTGPLLRVRLIRLEANDHLWVENIHHIISDDWSMKVFTREVAELYRAFSQGETPALAPPQIQYADFAQWQREWLQGDVLKAQVDYWKKQLGGTLPTLQLPTDRPRPANQTYRGTHECFVIPTPLYAALKGVSDREGVTLFMSMLAAFNTLLYRYSRQDDIIVGSPIAGRNQIETENVVGFFLNTLVLRIDLSGNPTFRELLGRVREVCLGAYAHQDIPFEPLLEQLRLKRDLSRTPLFQTMLVLLNTPVSAPKPTADTMGLTFSPVKVDNGTTKFDISLTMTETEHGIESVLDYNVDLFDAATVRRMIDHFLKLLESIARDPNQRIADLPLLQEAERARMLREWNDTHVEFTADACLHELVEVQVERTPDAPAVTFEEEGLSYRELNRRANQLAHHLRRMGVGPESRVGVCMERSLELIVGILGVLKAGAAYVPLDPIYPKDRIAFILEDAQVAVLLTQERLLGGLPAHEARDIYLDTQWESVALESEVNIASDVRPENAAIVIYTSGSTGKPKGTVLPHKGLVNYTEAANEVYAITAADHVLQFGSISFDLSAEEIFPSLTTGATLVLRTDSMLDSAATCLQKCEDWSISILDLPTLYWHELVARLHASGLSLPDCVRLVIIGGERALPEQLSLWHKLVGERVQLFNTYGPTEATIAATRCELPPPPEGEAEPSEVSIGRPINNVQVYLLDERLAPVPVGVPGELHIGGVGLARGYLNRPALTAEKFIPNPFSTEAGMRLYKTGDLARYLPDGSIEYVGRKDRQVKLRGFRIELSEIELALTQHPLVQEAYVIAHEDEPGQKRLVAYVVCGEAEEPLTTSALRRFLRERLPDYMIPANYIFLEQLPLNSNGKVDQRALPLPDRTRPDMEEGYVAPRTPTEEILAAIWSELLLVERIGVFDDFFELGGHSLMASQIIARVREAFQVEITLRVFFQAPNVSELSREIDLSERVDQTEADEIARTLAELEGLSEEEVRTLLVEMESSSG
jgi:amino acid adenylation domain-containing protein